MRWKKSILEISKILKLFVKKLTADDKYSVLNRDNLTESIQILLFEKQKASSGFFFFFFAFLKFRLNCEHFPKRNEPHR